MSNLHVSTFPGTYSEQAKLCASCADLDAVTRQFHRDLVNLLGSHLVGIMDSYCRTKTTESIERKLAYRGKFQPERSTEPLVDIHASTIVIEEYPEIRAAPDIIFKHWPTPEIFFGRFPRMSDYSQPGIRPRAESDPHYQPIHLRVVIPDGARIAEVKLFSPQDEAIAKLTQKAYEEKLRKALEG